MGDLVMADLDRWIPLARDLPWLAPGYGLEIFLGRDDLTDPDYQVRVQVGGGDLGVKCPQLVPRGFWIRPTQSGPLYVPVGDRHTTEEFRIDIKERR